MPFVLKSFSYDENTIFVGHSSGCPLILSILENITTPIKKAILVAGFCEPTQSTPHPILQDTYDWHTIKNNAQQFVFINSLDDPWGCNEKQGQMMQKKIGGELIICSNQGHMGSNAHNQPYKEFPLVKFFIEN